MRTAIEYATRASRSRASPMDDPTLQALVHDVSATLPADAVTVLTRVQQPARMLQCPSLAAGWTRPAAPSPALDKFLPLLFGVERWPWRGARLVCIGPRPGGRLGRRGVCRKSSRWPEQDRTLLTEDAR
jgi:hypothetical protein